MTIVKHLMITLKTLKNITYGDNQDLYANHLHSQVNNIEAFRTLRHTKREIYIYRERIHKQGERGYILSEREDTHTLTNEERDREETHTNEERERERGDTHK